MYRLLLARVLLMKSLVAFKGGCQMWFRQPAKATELKIRVLPQVGITFILAKIFNVFALLLRYRFILLRAGFTVQIAIAPCGRDDRIRTSIFIFKSKVVFITTPFIQRVLRFA